MSLQIALQEHFSGELPQVASGSADGIAVMGFAPFNGLILRGAAKLIESWLRDALNKGILPSKPELLDMAEKAFDKYVAQRVPDRFTEDALRYFFLKLVGEAYDQFAA